MNLEKNADKACVRTTIENVIVVKSNVTMTMGKSNRRHVVRLNDYRKRNCRQVKRYNDNGEK